MKIITWNCNMGFQKKAGTILSHQPDILIVPECKNLEKLNFAAGLQLPTDSLWHGSNPHKGISVFAYNGFKLEFTGLP
jgi:hypothetical protein